MVRMDFDIAVVGPGPVGAMAALMAARKGLSTVLIGPAAPRKDGRTVALMDASWRMIAEAGVADRLAAVSAPLDVMRLVDDTGSLFRRPPTEFRASEIGLDQFGWNVETFALSEALLGAIDAQTSIARAPAALTAALFEDGTARLTLEDGREITARLVVGSDGRASRVRAEAGIGAEEWRYPQAALTTIVRHGRDHRNVSTEFHTRSGPCTTVPLPGRRSSIVWMMDPAAAERHMAMDDIALAAAIERQIHSILGQLTVDGPRGLTPMGGLSVSRFTAHRAALIGEAAHVFPPIGAQGLNLGMRDVAALLDAVSAGDPGDAAGLARYERSRSGDVRSRTAAVDALNRSLLSGLLPVDFARGLGLLAIETIAPLRRLVMRQGLAPGGR